MHDQDERFGHTTFIKAQVVEGREHRQTSGVEEVFSEALKHARKLLVDAAKEGKDFLPMAFIYTPLAGDKPHVNVCLIAEGFNGTRSKHEIGKAMSQWAAKHQAAAIVLCTDGWAIKTPERYVGNEEAMNKWVREAGPPSEHPDRVEVLNVSCVYPDATAVGVIVQYKRVREDEGERIEWGEVSDGRTDGGKQEQFIIPAWSTGGVV